MNKLKNRLKRSVKKLLYKYENIETDSKYPNAFWWNLSKNFGDSLNYELIKKIAGVEHVNNVPHNFSGEHYFVVGSILHHANKNSVIWGSGIISPDHLPLFKPKKIHAVRGPLTRNILLNNGISCPEVYGDPALLMPRYFKFNQVEKNYELGIIPHKIDKQHKIFKDLEHPLIKIVDIETDDIEDFISQLLSCKKIISSSLHGIIVADSYGIPARRFEISELIGGDFKFEDYYKSVNRTHQKKIRLNELEQPEKLIETDCSVSLDFDGNKLLEACPFLEFTAN